MSSSLGHSHQLKNGLYVSGRPDALSKAEKVTAIPALSAPYTGGDLSGSGDLGKMFDAPKLQPGSAPRSGSGPYRKTSSTSSSSSSLFSPRPNPLQPTGLITSEPLRRSGQHSSQGDPAPVPKKPEYGSAVTILKRGDPRVAFRISHVVAWFVAIALILGVIVGVFLTLAIRKLIIIAVVGGLLLVVSTTMLWNFTHKKSGFLTYLRKLPNAELRSAADGQLVKVSGIVTCGSIPMESGYQKVPRCVYVTTEMFENRGWKCKASNPKTCFSSETHVADFYVSDFQSGLRALIKAGFGSKVLPFVKPRKTVDILKDGKTIQIREGYIKEGSSISVVGVVRRHENMLMVVPPEEPVATGCQWLSCLLPTYVDGLALMSEESDDADVIPV